MNVLFNLFDEFLLSIIEILEILSDFGTRLAEEIIMPVLGFLGIICLRVILFLSLPIWFVPYLISKKRRNTRNDDNKTAERQIFDL